MVDNRGEVVKLQETNEEKDLGVIIDDRLTFESHIASKVNAATRNMGVIRRTFQFLDEKMFTMLYCAQVRPLIEFANSVWHPYKVKDIETVERVQRRATKQVPGLGKLTYEERLQRLNLFSLSFRRLRGDLIEVFKIISGLSDPDTAPDLHLVGETITRGNGRKLLVRRAEGYHNHRKHFFTLRVANIWNDLPRDVVWAGSLKSFKNKLDKHLEGHPLRWSTRLP